jgi:hypothetical protein
VFWQCRPEKPTRPLTLNKDTVWYGLIEMVSWIWKRKNGTSHVSPNVCLFIWLIYRLIDQSIVYSRLSNFQLSGGCRHYRWPRCKIKSTLSTDDFLQWGLFYMPHLLQEGPGLGFIRSHSTIRIRETRIIRSLRRPSNRCVTREWNVINESNVLLQNSDNLCFKKGKKSLLTIAYYLVYLIS